MIKDVVELSSNFPSLGWKAGWQNFKQDGQIVWGQTSTRVERFALEGSVSPATRHWNLLVTRWIENICRDIVVFGHIKFLVNPICVFITNSGEAHKVKVQLDILSN